MGKEMRKYQDERVYNLWAQLVGRDQGRLDLQSLKEGLARLDHPLKDADNLLNDMLNAADNGRKGFIDLQEFQNFLEHTEDQLLGLFQSMDREHAGRLSKKALVSAFRDANIDIASANLDRFFKEIDINHDGVITFDEWRKFFLFMPAQANSLKAVLSYYSATMKVNSEGDVHVSDDKGEGIGKSRFLSAAFGAAPALMGAWRPPKMAASIADSPSAMAPTTSISQPYSTEASEQATFPWDPGDAMSHATTGFKSNSTEQKSFQLPRIALLTDLLPDPGYFIAGGIAGAVSRTATAPFDRLKVYLIAQTNVADASLRAAKDGAALQSAKIASRSLLEAIRSIWAMGGIASLFAGNGLNVLKVMPESAIKFGSYEGSKRMFARIEGHGDTRNLAPLSQFSAAGLGGMFSQFAIYPLDTLKFRMQNETVKGGLRGNALILATFRRLWQQGPTSFYRGLPMGLVGMFPYSAIDLTTFEYLKQYVVARNAVRLHCSPGDDSAAISNFTTAAIGAFSGALGATAVYPLNLLRTRLQSQGTAIHPRTYTGMWDVTVTTVQGEGFRGLFRGITPNLLKVVPAVSITYVVYDNSKRVLGLG